MSDDRPTNGRDDDRPPSGRNDDRALGERDGGNTGGRNRDDDRPESRLFTYTVPFAAALFLSLGIAGAVLGGWAIVQPAIGACSDPAIGVSTPAETAERAEVAALERIAFEDLGPAEQRAVDEAIDDPQREATVDGEFEHREAFEQGVVVTRDGVERYATVTAANDCLEVDPLALPLGVVSILVGLGAFALVAVRNYPWPFPDLRER
ncbi:hypothetical protein AB7C87_02955 [Natrarchaeobius sp. A-rgal3]|uniref:hypothetical protein n=1 Tax=Natrarchaeobius versutus TaxID=1679078 RepID=UPI00350EC7F0